MKTLFATPSAPNAAALAWNNLYDDRNGGVFQSYYDLDGINQVATIDLRKGVAPFSITGAGASISTGAGNDVIAVVGAGGAMIRAGLGLNAISFAGTGNTIVHEGGADTLTDKGSGNTIVFGRAGTGLVTIGANALSNQDVFDLRATMAGTAWDHGTGSLSPFLSVAMQGANAAIMVNPTGTAGGASSMVAVITGAGPTTLASLLPHTLT